MCYLIDSASMGCRFMMDDRRLVIPGAQSEIHETNWARDVANIIIWKIATKYWNLDPVLGGGLDNVLLGGEGHVSIPADVEAITEVANCTGVFTFRVLLLMAPRALRPLWLGGLFLLEGDKSGDPALSLLGVPNDIFEATADLWTGWEIQITESTA
jgi:hypothetical protein